jgi:hypothetical protein
MGEKRNACRFLVGKPEVKRPLGRPTRRWMDNIKMDILEIGWGGVNWIGLAQDGDKWNFWQPRTSDNTDIVKSIIPQRRVEAREKRRA